MSTTCALTTTIAELQDLLTLPDGWNSYDALAPDPDAVAHAVAWITEVYTHIMTTKQQWIEPSVTACANGEAVLSWCYGQKTLDVRINKQHIHYLQGWSRGANAKLTDGCINSIDDIHELWQWLLTSMSTGAIV